MGSHFDDDKNGASHLKGESGKEKIGKRIQNLREYNKVSKHRLAQYIGTSDSTVQNYEGGSTYPPSDKLLLIAQTFNCSTDWLLTGKGDNPFHTKLERVDPDSLYVEKGPPDPVFTNEVADWGEKANHRTRDHGRDQVVSVNPECETFCRLMGDYPALRAALPLLSQAMEEGMSEAAFLEYAGELLRNQARMAREIKKKG